MNPSAMRLAKKFGVGMEVAEVLVAAGYDCPRKVRDASDADLSKVVGESDLAKLRAQWKAKE